MIVDPLYLCLGGGSVRTENLFQVGPILNYFAMTCIDAGATPMILHHSSRPFAKATNQPMTLLDMAYSGTAEFTRSWLLLSRREPYEEGTGVHQLILNVGGSAGHNSLWTLDIDEGVIGEDFSGRRWDVRIAPHTEAIRNEINNRQSEKFQKQAAADQADDMALVRALDTLDPHDQGAGLARVQVESRLSDAKMARSLTRLSIAKVIEETMVSITVGNGAPRNGVRGIRRVKE